MVKSQIALDIFQMKALNEIGLNSTTVRDSR